MSGNSFAFADDGYTYSIRNNEVTISNYRGSDTDVTIPATIEGYPVVKIGNGCFSSKSITGVTLPDSVKIIDKNAFKFCDKLESVNLNEGLTSIGDYAFYECLKLKSLVLPSTLTTIGKYAIVPSSSMKYIFIPESVTSIDTQGVGYKRKLVYTNPNDPFTELTPNFTIYGFEGSIAQEYAESNSIAFSDINELYDVNYCGSSVRLSSPGIRLGYIFNKDDLSISDSLSYEFGFVYSYSELTEELNINNCKRKIATNYCENENEATYNIVFTNIPKANYDTDIYIRGYAIINGVIIYSEQQRTSVNNIIDTLLDDDSLSSETKDKIIEIFR